MKFVIYSNSIVLFQNDSVEFGKLWNPKLYIENSLGDPKESIRHKLVFNEKGEAFIYEKRVAKGTYMENLELDDFPFDVQVSINTRVFITEGSNAHKSLKIAYNLSLHYTYL